MVPPTTFDRESPATSTGRKLVATLHQRLTINYSRDHDAVRQHGRGAPHPC
jgi:hypothetical protein